MARRQLRGFRLPPGFLVGYFPWPPRDAPLQTPPLLPVPWERPHPPPQRNRSGERRRQTHAGRKEDAFAVHHPHGPDAAPVMDAGWHGSPARR